MRSLFIFRECTPGAQNTKLVKAITIVFFRPPRNKHDISHLVWTKHDATGQVSCRVWQSGIWALTNIQISAQIHTVGFVCIDHAINF